MAMAGRALVAVSLFFVLVWWRVSVSLFAVGWIVFGFAYVVEGMRNPWSGARGRAEEVR